MWHHKNKYHINIKNNDHKMTIVEHIDDQKMTTNDQIIPEIKITENTECIYCHKKLSAYTHLRRHMKTCKSKDDIIKENEILKKDVDEIKQDNKELKKTLDELKKQMLDMMNKKYKMHPKTFQKMVNTNSNNLLNNNNITINNNIRYIEIGREDLHTVFTKQEKLMILKKLGSPIENIVRYTHLNDKFPQFQNIIITNIRSNQAYAYNDQLNKFILCDKNDLLEDMIIYRYDDLIGFYEQYNHLLLPKLKDKLQKSFLLKDDSTFCKNKYKEFNVIIYNECSKDNIKYKLNDESLDNNILDN
jgi:hypothetical protein